MALVCLYTIQNVCVFDLKHYAVTGLQLLERRMYGETLCICLQAFGVVPLKSSSTSTLKLLFCMMINDVWVFVTPFLISKLFEFKPLWCKIIFELITWRPPPRESVDVSVQWAVYLYYPCGEIFTTSYLSDLFLNMKNYRKTTLFFASGVP